MLACGSQLSALVAEREHLHSTVNDVSTLPPHWPSKAPASACTHSRPPPNVRAHSRPRPRLSAQQSDRSCLARRTLASRSRWHRRRCPVSLLLCSLPLRFLALSSLSFALASLRCLVWLLSPSRVLHAPLAPSSPSQTHKQTHQRGTKRNEDCAGGRQVYWRPHGQAGTAHARLSTPYAQNAGSTPHHARARSDAAGKVSRTTRLATNSPCPVPHGNVSQTTEEELRKAREALDVCAKSKAMMQVGRAAPCHGHAAWHGIPQ